METEITDIRKHAIEKILVKQDDSFRWGFDEKQARERPEYVYYSPNFKSTLWTLFLLADIKAPVDLPQLKPSIHPSSAPISKVFRVILASIGLGSLDQTAL